MDNKNEDKRKLRYNKNTHELDLIDMEEDLIDIEDDKTTRLSFFEKLKVILIRNEIIYKTIFTLFGTMMTIALTYAGVKVASMANTIAKEQVYIQSMEADVELRERLPFFVINYKEYNYKYKYKFFIDEYADGIGAHGDIIFDLKKIVNDFDSEFTSKFGTSFVNYYNNPDIAFYIDKMHSFYSEIFSISTNIPYLFEMIIENNADTEMMEELSRDISKRIRDDYESIQIINKGGHISNTKIYPAFVFTFYVADNKLSYYMGGMNYQRGYFSQFGENKFESATLKIPDISYSEFAIETIRNELSKYYDIRLDYNLYIIIEYTDIFQENHRGLYLIEDDKITEITEKKDIDNMNTEIFMMDYYAEEIEELKKNINQMINTKWK